VIAALGLISAVIFGASDFFGGLASRRMSPLLATALGGCVAVAISGVAVLVERPVWTPTDVLFSIGAGVLGGIGTWTFYTGLAIGPMSIVSPGVAMIYAVVPALFGIALGERFSPLGYGALVVVVIAALLLAVPPQRGGGRITPRAIVFGTIAGVSYAGYLILLSRTAPASGLMPLFVELCAGQAVFVGALLVRRLRRGPAELAAVRVRRDTGMALLAGLLLVIANILLVIGLHLGDLAVMGVLNALYPLGTVLLALLVLRERIGWLQILGIVLALGASVVLALD
jgi:drug/metabolite transporter (DMT)-like permease